MSNPILKDTAAKLQQILPICQNPETPKSWRAADQIPG